MAQPPPKKSSGNASQYNSKREKKSSSINKLDRMLRKQREAIKNYDMQ